MATFALHLQSRAIALSVLWCSHVPLHLKKLWCHVPPCSPVPLPMYMTNEISKGSLIATEFDESQLLCTIVNMYLETPILIIECSS